jgi:DNA polymerase-3 subunit gamma/tau
MTVLRMLAFKPEGAPRALALPQSAKPKAEGKPKAEAAAAPEAAVAAADHSWPELVQQLTVTGAARELARNAELRKRDGAVFDLVVPKAKAYLAERSYVDKLKAALEQHLGSAVGLKVAVGEIAGSTAAALEAGEREAKRAAAAQAVQSDGFVQDLVNLFDGKVVDSTIREDRK